MKSWKFPALVLTMALAVAACNVNVNDGSGGTTYVPTDSGTTVVTHSETHSESNTGFEVKGNIHSESHSTTHTTTTVGAGDRTLESRMEEWATNIFPDYKTVDMDPMEAYPKYKTARQTIFRRLRVVTPISNSYGKSVYPRVLLKGYRFDGPEALAQEVETWLRGLTPDSTALPLGMAGDGLRTPPMLCAVSGTDFLVVQAACVYDGPEWKANKKTFFSTLAAQGASYVFEIACNGGKLTYQVGGDS